MGFMSLFQNYEKINRYKWVAIKRNNIFWHLVASKTKIDMTWLAALENHSQVPYEKHEINLKVKSRTTFSFKKSSLDFINIRIRKTSYD